MDLYDHTGFEEIQSHHKDNPDKAGWKEVPPVTEKGTQLSAAGSVLSDQPEDHDSYWGYWGITIAERTTYLW